MFLFLFIEAFLGFFVYQNILHTSAVLFGHLEQQQNKLPAVNYGKNYNSFPELLLHVKSKIT